MNSLILRAANSPYDDITKGTVLSQIELDNNFVALKGEVIYTAETNNRVVTLKKINGDDIVFELEDDAVTGGTYNNTTGVATFILNNGETFDISGFFKPSDDIFTTGGTYSNGTTIFNNNDGNSFEITGYYTGSTDVYISGMTFNNGSYDLTIQRNDGVDFTQSLAILAGDMTITGGTYNPIDGSATFTNNSGGTFDVIGFYTGATSDYWTSGSTGLYSIKAINDSGLDAAGDYSVAEGNGTLANGYASHSEGGGTQANGTYAHAEGYGTIASGVTSHAEGYLSQANGDTSHAEGYYNTANGDYSHVEGVFSTANGYASHSEGLNTSAIGSGSHSEGEYSVASGVTSHAEGYFTIANGYASHSEGKGSIASGYASHSEGERSIASGYASHAGGINSVASGNTSFVHGNYSQANGNNTVVLGANIVGAAANTTYVDNLLVKNRLGVNTSTALSQFHSVGSFRLDNKPSESWLDIDYYSQKSGSYACIYTNWFVPSADNRMYQFYTQHSDTGLLSSFYHPTTGYNNKNGGSTHLMYFDSGYDDALKQKLIYQLNGNDKLTLMENGNVVLGAENGVNNTYPSVLRASNAYSFLSDSPGKDIYIRGGSGRGTGAGGAIIFDTTPSGTTGNVLNTPVTRMTITPNGKVNILQMLNISNMSVYADNAAAIAGGLENGDVYRTSTGVLMIRY